MPSSEAPRLSLVDIRRLWPEILTKVGARRRMAWILLSQHAQAIGLEGRRLTLGFNNPGARESFLAGKNDEILRQCLIDLIGDDLQVEAVIDPSAQPGAVAPPQVTRPAVPESPGPPDPGRPGGSDQRGSNQGGSDRDGAGASAPTQQPGRPAARPEPAQPGAGTPPDGASPPSAPSAPRTEPAHPAPDDVTHDGSDHGASRDDRDADQMDTEQLLAHRLGAQLIEEIPRD